MPLSPRPLKGMNMPAKACRTCAEKHGIKNLDVFDRYARPGVCELCLAAALVCYFEGPAPSDLFRRMYGGRP